MRVANTVELRQDRERLFSRMREINDYAEAQKRDFSAEEQDNWDQATKDIDALDARINRLETLERRPAEEKDEEQRRRSVNQRELMRNPREIVRADDYKPAFRNFLKYGIEGLTPEERQLVGGASVSLTPEMRAMGVSTAAAGGYLVPQDFQRQIEQAMLFYGGMRAVATVIPTSDGADLPYPTSDDTSNTGEILSEGGTASSQDVATGARILKAYMYSSKIVRVSRQLLQDAFFDVEPWLAARLGERIGRITNTHFTAGNGANQPTGIMSAVTTATGRTGDTGTATSVTWDDLIQLEHSVDIAYRKSPGVRFMMNDQTLRDIRRIKDGEGDYLFQTDVRSGVPNTIDGYQYVINNDVPVMAANARSIVFGDLSKYIIRDVQGIQLLRLEELYAAQLQVAFLAFSRHDGLLIDAGTHPAKVFINSAT